MPKNSRQNRKLSPFFLFPLTFFLTLFLNLPWVSAQSPNGASRGEMFSQIGQAAAELAMSFEKDNEMREEFTKQYVAKATETYPNQNFVISHKGGDVEGEHVHDHVELRVNNGTIGYEVFASPKGKRFKFVRKGDGGYINWAYAGNFKRDKNNERIITAQ